MGLGGKKMISMYKQIEWTLEEKSDKNGKKNVLGKIQIDFQS